MEPIIPFVHFNGDCAEALEFYGKILDGKVISQSTYGEGHGDIPKEYKSKLMYANFQAGSLTLLASDTHPGVELKKGNNMSLTLHFSDVESIDKIFEAFSEGATITLPIQDTFWGARFGMLTDKFGINWMFNHDYPKKPE